jgi:hypothetical protein
MAEREKTLINAFTKHLQGQETSAAIIAPSLFTIIKE